MADRPAVLVLGGAGFIGSHCCVVLAKNYKVVVVDNLANSSPKAISRIQEITGESIDFHQIDVTNEALLDGVVAKYAANLAATILLAGLKAVGESVLDPVRYYETNISAAISIVKVLSRHNCKRLVFSSSATVYGEAKIVPIPETCPTGPLNPYGRTKLFIEHILQDVCVSDEAWQVIILRYFNPCGAHPSGKIGEDPNGVPNNLMPYLAQVGVGKLEKLSVYGDDYKTPDGTGVRDYLHVMDLAEGHSAAIEALRGWPSGRCEIYNLGRGEGVSVLEMLGAMSKAIGRELPFVIGRRRSGDTDVLCADVSKAKAELHWEAKKTILEMCQDLWNWQTKNPNGYRDA